MGKKAKADYEKLLKERGKGESKLSKMLVRGWWSLVMLAILGTTLYLGHIAMCVMLIALQSKTFRELADVRYKAHKAQQVPMFRTIQWLWFAAAIFYSYGQQLLRWMGDEVTELRVYRRYESFTAFSLYSALFVITVLYFKKGQYKYQLS